ncbi:hypothetical protein ACWDRB_47200 [Nonomuraea sp. NPDC003707]
MTIQIDIAAGTVSKAHLPLAKADRLNDHGGDPFQPDTIEVTWEWDSFTGWTLDSIEVFGLYIVKKTDKPGVRKASRGQGRRTQEASRLPVEYRDVADATRPTWTPPQAQPVT